MNENYVRIFDTTLRDGEQAPGFSMNIEEKLRLAVQLERLGVDVIEAGFPAASPDDFASVEKIAKTVKRPEICGLARATESDISIAFEAVKKAKKPRIHTFIATSPIHMEFKLKKKPEEILDMAVKAVKHAKSLVGRVDFSPEDGGRSDPDFLVEVITAVIEEGADIINIPDTVGYLMPDEFGRLMEYLIKNVKNSKRAIFSTHCHDDLGLAVANSLAGVANGARQVECTVNGAGERAGNASLEEIVMTLKTREDFFSLKTGINTREIAPTSRLLSQITGQQVQANKAIVGKNAFAHESGIHQHGVLANRKTYEIIEPQDVGIEKSEIVLGKHSGRAALKKYLEELGYFLDEDKLTTVFHKFKRLADQKKQIEIADLDAIMIGEGTGIPKLWKLESFSVKSETTGVPQAMISLRNLKTGKRISAEHIGTGMVDAAYQCVAEISGDHGQLVEFAMDAVTAGIDAQAVVKVRIKDAEEHVFFGKAASADIVEASIEAYLDAVNKAVYRKTQRESDRS